MVSNLWSESILLSNSSSPNYKCLTDDRPVYINRHLGEQQDGWDGFATCGRAADNFLCVGIGPFCMSFSPPSSPLDCNNPRLGGVKQSWECWVYSHTHSLSQWSRLAAALPVPAHSPITPLPLLFISDLQTGLQTILRKGTLFGTTWTIYSFFHPISYLRISWQK